MTTRTHHLIQRLPSSAPGYLPRASTNSVLHSNARCRLCPLNAIHSFPERWAQISTMLSRSAVPQRAQRAVRQAWQQQSRGLAEPASGSFQYATGEAQGIKIAARDFQGPVASVAIVSRAGTRFQALPGLAEGLKWYAFKVRKSIEHCGVGYSAYGMFTHRTPKDARRYGYSENLNSWALFCSPNRPERMW